MKSEAGSSSLGKNLHTSFRNIGHNSANAFGKAFLRPTSRVRRAGQQTSLIACLATVFVPGCWGYSLGLLMGKSTINGPFSVAMLNYQRVMGTL